MGFYWSASTDLSSQDRASISSVFQGTSSSKTEAHSVRAVRIGP